MHSDVGVYLKQLSSKSVLQRKQAIRKLARFLHHPDAYMVRLSLTYISEHDPSYTVRNLARQAFYVAGLPPFDNNSWERTYSF